VRIAYCYMLKYAVIWGVIIKEKRCPPDRKSVFVGTFNLGSRPRSGFAFNAPKPPRRWRVGEPAMRCPCGGAQSPGGQPSGFCPAAPRCKKRPLRGLAHCRVNDVSKWVKPSSLNPGVPVVK
jgi:hypothetical protein